MNTNNPNLNVHKKRESSNCRHYSKEQRPGPCTPWIKGPTLFQNTQKQKKTKTNPALFSYSWLLILVHFWSDPQHVSSEGAGIIGIHVKSKNRNSPLQVCPHRRKRKGPVLYLQQRSVQEIGRIHNARAACPPLERNPDPTVDQSIKY